MFALTTWAAARPAKAHTAKAVTNFFIFNLRKVKFANCKLFRLPLTLFNPSLMRPFPIETYTVYMKYTGTSTAILQKNDFPGERDHGAGLSIQPIFLFSCASGGAARSPELFPKGWGFPSRQQKQPNPAPAFPVANRPDTVDF
jgi:hypothetical protein